MQKEINLLPRKHVAFLQQEKTILGFRIIVIFSVIFVISSFGVVFFLQKNYSLSAIQNQQQAVISKLALFHTKATQELTLSDRVKKIQTIIKTRTSLVDKITLLQKQIPTNVTINAITLSKTTVSISLTSSSLSLLQNVIDALTGLVTQKKLLKKLTINNITVDQQAGTYSVNILGVLL